MKTFLFFWVALCSSSPAFALVDLPKDILSQRDPFKMPLINRPEEVRNELEMYPSNQFKLVGVLAGAHQMRAMISAPNGKTYFVKPGMQIGQKNGVISKITETAIFIREKTVNVLGNPENVDLKLSMPSDVKQDVKTITSDQGW